MYVHIETGEYPITEAQIRADHPQVCFPDPFAPCDCYAAVAPTAPPEHNPATHRVEEAAPVQDGDAWMQSWRVVKLKAAELAQLLTAEQARLAAAATAHRWAVETGGITLPTGTRVGTTVEDQNRISTVIGNAQLAGITQVDFKAKSGWVSLSLDDMRGISSAIARHVQACFSAERVHHEAIEALKTLSQALEYDVRTGWPA